MLTVITQLGQLAGDIHLQDFINVHCTLIYIAVIIDLSLRFHLLLAFLYATESDMPPVAV